MANRNKKVKAILSVAVLATVFNMTAIKDVYAAESNNMVDIGTAVEQPVQEVNPAANHAAAVVANITDPTLHEGGGEILNPRVTSIINYPVADPNQFTFLGDVIVTYDRAGNPDPILVNNGDGTWNIILYEGQTLALGLHNPWAAKEGYLPIMYTSEGFEEVATNAPTYLWLGDAALVHPSEPYTFAISGDKAGQSVCTIHLEQQYLMTPDYGQKIGNTITVGVFVLPAQPGAAGIVETQDEWELRQSNLNYVPRPKQIIGVRWN